ncbi:lysine biosynthesis protein LysX [bacterium]|nr:lysine biosynthesis protein LysX [bacterium]
MRKIKLGFLHTLIRPEEKFLINELCTRTNVDLQIIDERELAFDLKNVDRDLDIVLDRSVGYARSLNVLRVMETFGITCVNSVQAAEICGDKLSTSLALARHSIPQPRMRVAFSERAALQAIKEMGFPVVLKPAVGSWGRLLSKINDRETAIGILEHKKMLGSYHHHTYIIQEYIQKKSRDIRSVVIGNTCVAAIYRQSEHWITNAARGAESCPCEVTDEIQILSLQAAAAVGGGIVAIDLFETDDGYLVNEVNHTLEFKSCVAATGINIAAMMIDYVVQAAEEKLSPTNGKCADFYLSARKNLSASENI